MVSDAEENKKLTHKQEVAAVMIVLEKQFPTSGFVVIKTDEVNGRLEVNHASNLPPEELVRVTNAVSKINHLTEN